MASKIPLHPEKSTRMNTKTIKKSGTMTVVKTDADADHELNGDNGDKKVRYKSLVIDGTKYMTRYNKKFENRKSWNNPDPKKIFSFIPGTIVKVYVKEGQEVKPGDDMLVLEAMKMKNRVVFQEKATIKSIWVEEGEKIPKNHLMLELE